MQAVLLHQMQQVVQVHPKNREQVQSLQVGAPVQVRQVFQALLLAGIPARPPVQVLQQEGSLQLPPLRLQGGPEVQPRQSHPVQAPAPQAQPDQVLQMRQKLRQRVGPVGALEDLR